MEAITSQWNDWNENAKISISLPCYIEQIVTYPASYQSFNYWKYKLKKAREKLICQDCVVVDKDGDKLRLTTNPGLPILSRLESTFVEITSLTKTTQCGHPVLVINEWKDTDTFPLKNKGYLTLKNYADQKKPLCNPFSDLLNPWSNSNFLWNPETVSLKKIQSLKQLKLDYNFNHHNLKQLDRTWSSLTQTLKFPLIVRVLAKCKEKLILQQTNHRKTWMCLSNVLIADNSGYSVLTIWDEAVADFHKNLKEGDILVLNGSYMAGTMRTNHRKLIHNIGPKVRHPTLELAPTGIELKLNKSDLNRVSIVHSGATCDTIPGLLCNFMSVEKLIRRGAAAGRMVDLVGVVTMHGRWEREGAWHFDQFWVRVWLQIMDHTSDKVVNVKMFVDQEAWDELEAAVLGEMVILTNLVSVFHEAEFSHLESSNQTSVFSGESTRDSRWCDQGSVRELRDSVDEDPSRWARILKLHGGIGGQFCLCPDLLAIISILDSDKEIINPLTFVDILNNLPIRGSKRILIKARICGIWKYYVESDGEAKLVETIASEKEEDKKLVSLIGSKVPDCMSAKKILTNLNESAKLTEAVKHFCFLNISEITENDLTHIRCAETEICIVSLVMGNVKIFALMECPLLKTIQEEAYENFMLDCFRLRQSSESDDLCEGVELVLRQVVKVKTSSDSESLNLTDADRSLLSDTFDIANALL